MRLIRWKRIGQSDRELVAAVLFSFVIHGLLVVAVLVFSLIASSKVSVPISYQVMLVSDPAAVETALPQEAPPLSPKPEKAPAVAPRPKASTTAKSAMPELGASKAAKKKLEQQPEETTEKEKPAAPSAPVSAGATAKKEAVAVSAGQQANLPGLSSYLPLVRDKIARNWNPPPGVREARAKIMFRILRSGRLGEVNLQEPSGNFYFDQAANRSVLSSTPFPPLPDEYPREYLELSVDLIPKD